MKTESNHHTYAQDRANETGKPYAVFECVLKPELKYSALLCTFNRKAYATIGAVVSQIFRPVKLDGKSTQL